MNYEDRVTKEYVEGLLAGAGPKIAIGTYTGDGTSGVNNPTGITLDFPPKLLIIVSPLYATPQRLLVAVRGMDCVHSSCINAENLSDRTFLTWDGNTVWLRVDSNYNDRYGDTIQFNKLDAIYTYFAIG